MERVVLVRQLSTVLVQVNLISGGDFLPFHEAHITGVQPRQKVPTRSAIPWRSVWVNVSFAWEGFRSTDAGIKLYRPIRM